MKTRKQLFLLLSMFISSASIAQVEHGGEPYQWQSKSDVSSISIVSMPSVDVDALRAQDAVTEQHKDIPLRFAFAHEVSLNPSNAGEWITADNGDKIWRLAIESEGAHSLNLTFDQFELIDGASLFIYNFEKTYKIGAFTKENNKPSGTLGTAPVQGDGIIVEYREPSDASQSSKLSISHVAHDYKDAFKLAKGFGTSGSCNNNVACPISAGWEAQVSSVALITLGNGTRWCTGAMIANTSGDDTPYFLTADHCIDGQNVTNWIFYFNYESASCTPNVDGPLNQSVSGSTLRANSAGSDMCLLELSSVPPASYNVYYNGWDNSGDPVPNAVGIHHPDGDVKKFSVEDDALVSNGSYWTVNDWDDGTTEPGSSGSPLFDQNKRIVGQLYGGAAACGNDLYDEYGKISASWNGANASSRLKDWLDPNNTGAETHDGYYPGSASLAEHSTELTLELFPNPSAGVFQVSVNSEEPATIRVMNSLGATLFTLDQADNQEYIDLSNHAKGVYFIEVANSQGRVVQKAYVVK